MAKYKVEIVDLDYYRKQIACQVACPVQTDARGFVNAVAEGDYEAGYIGARQPNPFVSVCGRVCNAPCETACRRGNIDAPVPIRALKRFVCERYGAEAITHLSIARPAGGDAGKPILSDSIPLNSLTKESLGALEQVATESERRVAKVAVIGAGPAGLAAAHDLAVLGHRVTIFEALPEPGGMMRVGIPRYRLPDNVLNAEIDEIKRAGVDIKLNTKIESLDTLFSQGYEAVFVALGAHKSTKLNIEGEDLPGVMDGATFLKNASLGQKIAVGDKVAVIGGGNVAIDSARTARRLGAKEITIVYRRTRAEMPARPEEVEAAIEENIKMLFLASPLKITREDGRLKLACNKMELGEPDASGRRRPVPVKGGEFSMDFDSIIEAIGQIPDVPNQFGVKIGEGNVIEVNEETMATDRKGVYAGGDVVFGPGIIIEAIRDGHTAARAIDNYLQGRKSRVFTRGWMERVSTEELTHPEHLEIPRQRPPTLTLDRRVGMTEVEYGYPQDMAIEQASRCLKCNIQTVFNSDLCILCGGCVDVCPMHCLKLVPLAKIEGASELADLIKARYGENTFAVQPADADKARSLGTAIIKDEARCIRCGLCSRRCPTGAITMEAFWFEEKLISSGEQA